LPGTGHQEVSASLSGAGSFEIKPETSAVNKTGIIQQYQKAFVHTEYQLIMEVSRKTEQDDTFGIISNLGEMIGDSFNQKVEDLGADLFNDMFDGAEYKAEDDKAICHTAHTNVDGGNSQGNLGTTALTVAGLTAAQTAAKKLTNYRGTSKIKFRGDIIAVPVDLEFAGWEIVNSQGRPDSANNGDNMFNGRMSLMVWDELTDVNDWFLIDSRKMDRNLKWHWRMPFEVAGTGDLIAGTRTIAGYFRSSHGCKDWRWVYGNQVA